MHTLVFWDSFDGMVGKLKIGRNVFLCILGIIGMVFGTIYSIKDIIEYFIDQSDEGSYPKCNDVQDLTTLASNRNGYFIPIQIWTWKFILCSILSQFFIIEIIEVDLKLNT